MRRPRFVVTLVVAYVCWLAAGPGGVGIQASLACRHQQMHHHHHHGAPAGPCFCDQMGGGSDAALSETLPAPVPLGVVCSAPTLVVAHAAPAVPRSPAPPAPPTPPPNAALAV